MLARLEALPATLKLWARNRSIDPDLILARLKVRQDVKTFVIGLRIAYRSGRDVSGCDIRPATTAPAGSVTMPLSWQKLVAGRDGRERSEHTQQTRGKFYQVFAHRMILLRHTHTGIRAPELRVTHSGNTCCGASQIRELTYCCVDGLGCRFRRGAREGNWLNSATPLPSCTTWIWLAVIFAALLCARSARRFQRIGLSGAVGFPSRS